MDCIKLRLVGVDSQGGQWQVLASVGHSSIHSCWPGVKGPFYAGHFRPIFLASFHLREEKICVGHWRLRVAISAARPVEGDFRLPVGEHWLIFNQETDSGGVSWKNRISHGPRRTNLPFSWLFLVGANAEIGGLMAKWESIFLVCQLP